MISKILQLFIASFLCKSVLGFEEIKVLNFDPIYGSSDVDADHVRIIADPITDLSRGFSVCLRANFKIFNKKCLFKFDNNLHLSLEDYKSGGGEMFFNKIFVDFEKDSDELVSAINIFCCSKIYIEKANLLTIHQEKS